MKEQHVHICFMLCRCRTGSTALNKAISAHERGFAFFEIFNSVHKHSYQNYLLNILGEDKANQQRFLNEGPLFAFEAYIQHLLALAKQAKPKLDYFVFECKIENLQVFGDIWSHPGGGFNTISILRRSLAMADSVMFLRRNNAFERYLSALAAQSTGIFHSDQGPQAKSEKRITSNPKATLSALKGEVAFDTQLQDHLKRVAPRLHLQSYERVYQDSHFSEEFLETFAKISGGIRLDQPKLSKVRTMAGGDLIANYEELYSAMSQSPELSWMVNPPEPPNFAC